VLDRERIENLLLREFDKTYIERGKRYLEEKRVLFVSAKEEEDVLVLRGKVRGNYRNAYFQEIYIDEDEIVSNCTCPVGFNCKHVVAVILKYLENKRDEEFESVKYIERLKKMASFLRTDLKSSSTFLLTYRLEEVDTVFGNCGLTIYKSSFVERGEEKIFNKGKRLSIKSLLENYHRDYVTLEDIEIIKLLYDVPISYFGGSNSLALIKGELGALIIEKAAATGRLFWKDRITPIRREVLTLTPEFFWKEERGLLKLALKPDIADLHLLPTQPLIAYNHKENTLFRIGEHISKELLQTLSELPPLEPSEAAQVYLILNDLNLKVEKVKEVSVKEISVSPVPVLRLFRKGDRFIVDLKFRYGKTEIFPDSHEKVLYFSENNAVFKVARSFQEEEKLLERINQTDIREIFRWRGFKGRAEIPDYSEAEVDILKSFFLFDVPELRKEGWEVLVEDDFFDLEDGEIVSTFEEESDGWFSLAFKVKAGNEEIFLAPLLKNLLEQYDVKHLPEVLYLEYRENRFVSLRREDIKPIIDTISQLLDRVSESTIKVSPYDLHLIEVDVPEKLKEIRELLKNFKKIEKVKPPNGLKTTLRNYQIEGISWLNFLHRYKLGGILADDMGLGKTVQTIAHLLRLKEEGELEKPAIIIVPTSLIANWEREILRFAPDLSFKTVYGKDRKEKVEEAFAESADVLLTTYNLIMRDVEIYKNREFSYIILDEAQKIKNYRTKTYRAVTSLKGEHRLALSGTPIENNLSELWAIFNFLMPGFLGTATEFKRKFQTPIERGDSKLKTLLGRKIRPFILRRTKKEVLKELPPKVEIIKFAKFSEKEARLYESIRVLMEKEVREAIKSYGFKKSQIYILDALLKLRQVCCHPSLLKIKEAKKVKESAKLEFLKELLEELISEGKKVLIFSQFVSMLEIIEKEVLKKKGYSYEVLTGKTRNRKKVIDRFKKGKDIFLISLKAGGLGLNLTEADTVILYEPWWNPAVESQATDRVYRIGQEKKVFVYKLIVENSVEEKILELQKKKKDLQALYEEGVDIGKLSQEEILSLFES